MTDTTPLLIAALLTGTVTLVVVIVQAVRFFRNNRGE